MTERFKKKLSGWKRGYLSKGGKLTLIKSTLQNLPIYFMSFFKISSLTSERSEKKQRNFVGRLRRRAENSLGKLGDSSFKGEGDLGIKNINIMNRALLSKWIWPFARDGGNLWEWREVVGLKYGHEWGNWWVRDTWSRVMESYHGGI